MKPVAALCSSELWQLDRVFGQGRREQLAEVTHLLPDILHPDHVVGNRERYQSVEVLFSTWGMTEELAKAVRTLPHLKAFFYAAGSVQGFARPLLENQIQVVSAWAANAVPVAQFTLAQILLSLKAYFRDLREIRLPAHLRFDPHVQAPGILNGTVALLGFGMVGREVARLLRPHGIRILAYAPLLPVEEADREGIRLVTLAEAFSQADIVSNHLADLPATRGLLTQIHFDLMREGATFINTGRGATLIESDLREVLQKRPDLTALLDVVDPEPLPLDSPWHQVHNAVISSHIAGSIGGEVVRMADLMLEEFKAWRNGQALKYEVTLEMLKTMA
jgi:phosphoglycerate dehydrogenase-like enzyme